MTEPDAPPLRATDAEMILGRVRAISFDLDNTLWDCDIAIERAEGVLRDWIAEHAPRLLDEHGRHSIAERRRRLLEANPELDSDVSLLRKRSLAELFREADYEHALSEHAFEVFYRARSDVELYDGADAMLADLGAHYRLAAITNGNADLGIVGIDSRFELCLKATLELAAKPAPTMYQRCLEYFELEPHELLHVGDSPTTDIAGAHAARVPAVWYNARRAIWPRGISPPALEVRSIAELHALLSKSSTYKDAGS